jgi:hypothetical protein
VPLHCQQELHTQGFLAVPTGKNAEDLNLVSVEAMQWVLLLYLSWVMISVTENISHSMAKMRQSTILKVDYSFSYTYMFQ